MNLLAMLNTLNTQLFYWVNQLAGQSPFFDTFFIFLTTTGFDLVLVFTLMYFFVIAPLREKNLLERLRIWREAIMITISAFVTWGIVWCIKILASAPRPFETLAGVRQLVEESVKTSFPSNHAALSMALATAVYFHNKKLGIVLFVIALIVSFSRVYVGVHYPVDVLVGGIIGIVIPWGLISVFKPSRE